MPIRKSSGWIRFLVRTLFVLGLGAGMAQAVPIAVVFSGDIGVFRLVIDFDLQPPGTRDIHEVSGDFVGKQSDYRINVADNFVVSGEGMAGGGFDWYLERFPPGIGIFELYSEILIANAVGDVLILLGPPTSAWKEGELVFAGILRRGGVETYGNLSIASMDPFTRVFPPDLTGEAVPEPGSVALVLLGLSGLAALRGRRRRRVRPLSA